MAKFKDLLDKKVIEYRKGKEKQKLSVITMALSAFEYKRIELGRVLTDEDELNVLKKELKSYTESLTEAEKAQKKRPEVEEEAKLSIAVIKEFLPEEMSKEDAKEIIVKLLADNGITSMKEMGKAMGLAMSKLKNEIDGNIVRAIVTEILK